MSLNGNLFAGSFRVCPAACCCSCHLVWPTRDTIHALRLNTVNHTRPASSSLQPINSDWGHFWRRGNFPELPSISPFCRADSYPIATWARPALLLYSLRSTIPVARQPSSASALSTPVVVADGVPRDVDDSGRENVTTCQQLEDPTNIVNVLKPQRNKTWLMLQPFPAFSCKKI
jgi:hypothetical protein